MGNEHLEAREAWPATMVGFLTASLFWSRRILAYFAPLFRTACLWAGELVLQTLVPVGSGSGSELVRHAESFTPVSLTWFISLISYPIGFSIRRVHWMPFSSRAFWSLYRAVWCLSLSLWRLARFLSYAPLWLAAQAHRSSNSEGVMLDVDSRTGVWRMRRG